MQLTPSLTATVAFDDYQAGGAPLTLTCVSPNCGFSATQEAWIWGNGTGTFSSPSTTTTLVSGSAAKVVFTTAPVGAGEGVNFTSNPVVSIEDANNLVVTGDNSNVTLAITGYSPGNSGGSTQGTLGGCVKSNEAGGAVYFTNCIDQWSCSGGHLHPDGK